MRRMLSLSQRRCTLNTSFIQEQVSLQNTEHIVCDTGNPNEGLYTEELRQARVLSDLSAAQYSLC